MDDDDVLIEFDLSDAPADIDDVTADVPDLDLDIDLDDDDLIEFEI